MSIYRLKLSQPQHKPWNPHPMVNDQIELHVHLEAVNAKNDTDIMCIREIPLDVKIFYDGTILTNNNNSHQTNGSNQLVPGVSSGSDIMGYTLNNDMQEFPMSMLADQQAAMLVHSLGCDNKIPTTWQPSSSNSNTTTAQADVEDIPGLLSYTPKLPKITIDKVPSNNYCVIFCQLSTSSMRYDSKKFTIEVRVHKSFYEKNANANIKIIPCHTPSFYAVMHKLVIEEKFDSQWVWYKDEPKTEKYYVIQVSLQDSQGNNILDRKFPILPLLTYSNKQPVPNQSNILQVNEAESRLFIDSKPGVIKFRINDVSHKHQQQAFRLFVASDTKKFPISGDIAPAFTVPVEVKSKKSKKDRLTSDGPDSVYSNGSLNGSSYNDLKITNRIIDAVNPSAVFKKKKRQDYMMSPVTSLTSLMNPLDDDSSSMNPVRNIRNYLKEVLDTVKTMRWLPNPIEIKNPSLDIDYIFERYNAYKIEEMLQLAENMCQSACGGRNIGLGLSGASPRTVEQTKEASDFLYPQLAHHASNSPLNNSIQSYGNVSNSVSHGSSSTLDHLALLALHATSRDTRVDGNQDMNKRIRKGSKGDLSDGMNRNVTFEVVTQQLSESSVPTATLHHNHSLGLNRLDQ
jgi:hypothetical protein